MNKLIIIMISNENCIHCINAKKVLELFIKNNKNLVELQLIYQNEYKKLNTFGVYDEFPVFILIGKSGNHRTFDFINDDKTERTYEKLKSKINEIYKLL